MKSVHEIFADRRCPAKVLKLFAAKIKKKSYEEILFEEDLRFSSKEILKLEKMISRYESHEPISKIINKRGFWESEFFVNTDVLDPRPETELIIEQTLKLFEKKQIFDFLDVGIGSGCILLSIAKEFPNSHGIGIDKSESAVKVAKKNKKKLQIENVKIKCIDWNEFYPKKNFDLIVSNPPYIKRSDIQKLDENVKNFDPISALDGGDSGLEAYKQLSDLIGDWISPDGTVLFEIGINQSEDVKNILEKKGFVLQKTLFDLQNIPRVLQFSVSI